MLWFRGCHGRCGCNGDAVAGSVRGRRAVVGRPAVHSVTCLLLAGRVAHVRSGAAWAACVASVPFRPVLSSIKICFPAFCMPVLAVDAPVLPGATRRSAAVRLALGVLTRGTAGFTGRCCSCRVIVSPYRGGSVCSGGASLAATSACAAHAWAAAPMALCLRARPAWWPCLVVPNVGARAGLLAAVGVVGVSGGGRVPLGLALAVAAASVSVTLAGSAGPCGCCRVIVSPCRGGSVGSGGALPAAI